MRRLNLLKNVIINSPELSLDIIKNIASSYEIHKCQKKGEEAIELIKYLITTVEWKLLDDLLSMTEHFLFLPNSKLIDTLQDIIANEVEAIDCSEAFAKELMQIIRSREVDIPVSTIKWIEGLVVKRCHKCKTNLLDPDAPGIEVPGRVAYVFDAEYKEFVINPDSFEESDILDVFRCGECGAEIDKEIISEYF